MVSMTTATGPKQKYASVNEYLESVGAEFNETENEKVLVVTYPQGWTMFRDYDFHNIFYVLDENGVGPVVFHEYDHNKYRDQERAVHLWEEIREDRLPFTYPLPDLYHDKDGYLEINPELDIYGEIAFIGDFRARYNKYLTEYNELDSAEHEDILHTLVQDRDTLQEIITTPYLREYRNSERFLHELKEKFALPLTFDEIVGYMSSYYSTLLRIKQAIIDHQVEDHVASQPRNIQDDF